MNQSFLRYYTDYEININPILTVSSLLVHALKISRLRIFLLGDDQNIFLPTAPESEYVDISFLCSVFVLNRWDQILQLNWVILAKIVFQLFQLIWSPHILFIVGTKHYTVYISYLYFWKQRGHFLNTGSSVCFTIEHSLYRYLSCRFVGLPFTEVNCRPRLT